MRVLSDIVKRRSFRANVERLQSRTTDAPTPTSLFVDAFLHPSEDVGRILKSVKLDRLTVGAILKQAGLSNQCPAVRVDASRKRGELPCGPSPRWVGIDNESDQVSKGHLVDALALRGDEGRTTLR
jgi:hypothetical protein